MILIFIKNINFSQLLAVIDSIYQYTVTVQATLPLPKRYS